MTNEIKEIIEYLKDDSMFISDEDGIRKELTLDESKLLLDYITNLQKENERLKELCDKYEEEHSTTFEYWKRLVKEDYITNLQHRIDKAIEYLEQPYRDNFDYSKAELLNILRGDDNE